MTVQELNNNLAEIKKHLEMEVQPSAIIDVQNKLQKLSSLSALSCECLKYAKQDFLYKQNKIINQLIKESLPASILKLKIESELWEEGAKLLYADRLNAAIVHVNDSLRTIISLYKSEMENSKFQS